MYRSASTLQYQIASHLVCTSDRGEQIGWIEAQRFTEWRDRHAHTPTLKVIKVHTCTDAIAREFLQERAMGIYTFRDLRDVVASYVKHKQQTFEQIWQTGFLEDCLNNFARWTSLPQVLVSRYEWIVADAAKEVERIAAHLGIPVDAQGCQAIAQLYSPELQQQRIQQFQEQLSRTVRSPNDHRSWVDYHDKQSLLHINHLNSGKTGRWQDELSPAEVEKIDRCVKQWCARQGYHPSTFFCSSPHLGAVVQ